MEGSGVCNNDNKENINPFFIYEDNSPSAFCPSASKKKKNQSKLSERTPLRDITHLFVPRETASKPVSLPASTVTNRQKSKAVQHTDVMQATAPKSSIKHFR
ncbi:hypothetical protein DCAR_0625033 [Daucus carota subsp. sativus]|uniref:Uncharacterized protein n=1 Tax=Daucus carota subsp. sativus TaxID=79200 RepID=A0A161YER2_DAUCS|nr:hypothetical protein DCAR_0625033 [Daucus carota subsp. sativus]